MWTAETQIPPLSLIICPVGSGVRTLGSQWMALLGTSVEPSGGGDSLAEVGSLQELGVYGVGKLEVLRAGLISSLHSAFELGTHYDQQPSALGTPPSLP